MSDEEDLRWMKHALGLARRASAEGEVPVGAVLIAQGKLLGEGRNRPIGGCDPSAHAEILALRSAAARQGNYRLVGSTLYVTLEPCPMCAGALVHARVARVVYGAPDPRSGACGSVFNLLQSEFLNHRCEIRSGVLDKESAQLLRAFFRVRREQTTVQNGEELGCRGQI